MKNFPKEFIEEYEIVFQEINKEKKITTSKELNEEKIIELVNKTIKYRNFKSK